MKKIALVLIIFHLSLLTSLACTNFIVGKKASADGNCF